MPNRQKAILPHICRLIQTQLAGDLTDGQLLERFLDAQDAEAFATLVRRHGRTVLGVCRRVLSNTHDAEDAFQATFLVLIRKARSIAKREAVGSWLYSVAYRVALKARTEAVRRRRYESHALDSAEDPGKATGVWDEVRPILDEEVNRLPDKYRRPIVLCYFEGKTYGEAAQLLGWPAGTTSVRLARAREVLRARLALRGLALSAGALAAGLAEGSAAAAELPLLVDLTARAALRMAAGAGAADVSTQVVALTEGMVKAMLLRKLKILVGILLVVGITCGGASFLGRSAGTAPAAAADPQDPGEGPVTSAAPTAPLDQPPAEAVTPPARPFLYPSPGGVGGRPAQTRIGLINLARVIKGSKKFQAFQAGERARTQQFQKRLDTLKARARKYEIESTDPAATASEREYAVRQLRQLQRQMDEEAATAKSELSQLSGEAFSRMYRDVAEAAQRFANANGLELVLCYNEAVTEADFYQPANLQRKMTQPGALMPMVVAPGMDISDAVLEALNARVVVPPKGPAR
jgi:RNA polymerase sigma factor (sigma-70 family)